MDALYFYKQKLLDPLKFGIKQIRFWLAVNFWPQVILESINRLDLTGTEVDRHLLLSRCYFVSATTFNTDTKELVVNFPGNIPEDLNQQIIKAIGYKYQLTIETL